MTQQSHYWAYTLRKPQFKNTHVPSQFIADYLQQPGHGNMLDVHQQMMDKEAVVHTHSGLLLSHK